MVRMHLVYGQLSLQSERQKAFPYDVRETKTNLEFYHSTYLILCGHVMRRPHVLTSNFENACEI